MDGKEEGRSGAELRRAVGEEGAWVGDKGAKQVENRLRPPMVGGPGLGLDPHLRFAEAGMSETATAV